MTGLPNYAGYMRDSDHVVLVDSRHQVLGLHFQVLKSYKGKAPSTIYFWPYKNGHEQRPSGYSTAIMFLKSGWFFCQPIGELAILDGPEIRGNTSHEQRAGSDDLLLELARTLHETSEKEPYANHCFFVCQALQQIPATNSETRAFLRHELAQIANEVPGTNCGLLALSVLVGKYPSEETIDLAIRQLPVQLKNPEINDEVVYLAISDFARGPDCIPALQRGVNCRNAALRKACSFALREMQSVSAAPYLGDALESEDVSVSYNAVAGLHDLATKYDSTVKCAGYSPGTDEFANNPAKYVDFWKDWLDHKGQSILDERKAESIVDLNSTLQLPVVFYSCSMNH